MCVGGGGKRGVGNLCEKEIERETQMLATDSTHATNYTLYHLLCPSSTPINPTHRAVSLGLPVPLHTGMVVYPDELGPPLQRLGSGAQGEVYLALLRGTTQVAVKVCC